MAIDFNEARGIPDASGTTNYSGRSQGTGPNEAFGELFATLGNVWKAYSTTKDAEIRANIEDDSRQIFDGVNQEFGYEPPAHGSYPPSDMGTDIERMKSLTAARQQGKISEVNYYGRLATLSKQLRIKYPGYEDVVDSSIQSVTGIRPANAYRDAILSEIQAEQNAMADEDKFRRQYEKENEGIISAVIGPDYFDNPDQYDFNKVRVEISRFKGRKELIDAEIKDLDLVQKTEGVNSNRAEKVISKDFSFLVEAELNRALGANKQSFQQTLDTFIQGGMKGQDLDQFIATLGQAENNLRNGLLAKGRKDYAGVLTQDKINKAVEDAMAHIKMAKEAVLGGDFKLASRAATINKALSDEALSELFKKYPEFQIASGIGEINKNVSEQIIDQLKIDNWSTIAQEVMGQTAKGNKEILKDISSNAGGKVNRAVIDFSPKAIMGWEGNQEGFSNLIDGMFGKSGPNYMVKVKPLDQITLFTKFLDPRVTKAIKEKGTPEDFQKYASWALESFSGIAQFKSAAGDLEGADVGFDPNTKRFILKSQEGPSLTDTIPVLGAKNVLGKLWGNKTQRDAINTLNSAISVLEPIIEAGGDDQNVIVQKLIKDLNINLENGKSDSFWGKVFGAVQSTDLEKENVLANGLSSEDVQMLSEQGDYNPATTSSAEVNSILDMLGKSEGADYKTAFAHSEKKYGVDLTGMTLKEVFDLQSRMAQDLGSSAVGKYQVIRGTLRAAVRELGLNPDMVLFNEETQDKIGEYLLNKRGLSDWREGKISNKQFLNNVAREWASVPTSSGRSFYHNDKMGNKATKHGTALAKFLINS